MLTNSLQKQLRRNPKLERKLLKTQHMRKMVEEVDRRRIIVKYNSPVVVKSLGLLKRKRIGDDLDDSFGGRGSE